MSLLSRAVRSVAGAYKAFTLRLQSSALIRYIGSTGRYDYRAQIGDGGGNSIVTASLNWIAGTFPEAPLRLRRRARDGTVEELTEHPFALLMESPNPFYSAELLWHATLYDFNLTGNAYWWVSKSANGRPVELYWIPSTMLAPKWEGEEYVSAYVFDPGTGRKEDLAREDVIHFRYGLDRQNIRLGLSPLAALLREIWSDEEAGNFTGALLRNMGVPPVLISPEADVKLTEEQAERIKTLYMAKTTGDARGEPLVLSAKVRVQQLAWNPKDMNLRDVRKLPEERVSAALRVPAVVVGLGAGLDRSTFSNMAEAREAAYESCIIPTYRLLAGELRTQLLPQFDRSAGLTVYFDTANVRVLQEDENARSLRLTEQLKGGGIKLGEYRSALGYPVDDSMDVYLRPLTIIEIAPGGQPLLGPAATEEPTSIRAAARLMLPAGAKADVGGVELSDDEVAYLTALEDATAISERAMAGDVAAYFERALTRAERGLDLPEKARKAFDLDAIMGGEADAADLLTTIRRGWSRQIIATWPLMNGRLGEDRPYSDEDEAVRKAVAQAGLHVTGIRDTSRARIQAMVGEAAERGYTAQQLLDGVPSEGFPGLRRTFRHWKDDRAALIARTEMARAQNVVQLERFRASPGVRAVMMLDGADFDAICAARNGRVVELDAFEAAIGEEHPNGRLRCVPVMGAPAKARTNGHVTPLEVPA